MTKLHPSRASKALAVSLPSLSIVFSAFPLCSATAQETGGKPVDLPPLVVETNKAAKSKKAAASKNAPATAVSQPEQPPTEPQRSPSDIANDPKVGTAQAAAAKLQIQNTTGSALGLTPEETPATVNIVSRRDIEEKGARGLVETFRTVPGVVVGNNPGEVGTTVTRGFYKATGFSVDGSRTADPVFLPRDYSSFHFERVEVLKGPASVVSGTSGLAGSFNIVTKQATTERSFSEAMVSYGSFDTVQTGIGTNIVLSPDAAIRSTFTFSGANGYVDDTGSEKYGFTNNILLKPTDDLKITASADYFKDDISAYYGTPLIDRSVARRPTDAVSSPNGLVLDRSIRYKNYDFEDSVMESESLWLRSAADYKLSSNWTFRNELNYYHADRLWKDADFYTYSAGLITRGTSYISHDHEFWSDRMLLSFDGYVGGFRNRFAAGAEYMETTFGSTRRFGSTPGVDIFDPDRGTYPAGTLGTQQATEHVTKAVFAENAINLTREWLVSAGIRYETIDLDRTIFNEATRATQQFGNDFESTTWRIGTTYEIVEGTSLFAQYAEAVVPITALMLSSFTNSQFELSTGTSAEIGIKSTLFDGRVTTTASVYEITQDDIITRNPANPAVPVQGGSQRSRGIEAEAAIDLTSRWNLALSGTLIDAEFTELRTASADLTGNRPLNSVPWAWSALTTYRLEGLPATVGAQLSGVGPFYTSNANLYEAKERTVLDAWIAFDVGSGTLAVRGRNLTNEFYAEWADYNETSLYVAPPRSFDVTYSVKW